MTRTATRRIRKLRSPFLVTIATLAGALGGACGGSVGGESPGNGGGAAGTGGSSGTGGSMTGGSGGAGGAPSGCPDVEPVDGTTCVNEGAACLYPFCGDPVGMSAKCMNGQWAVQPLGSCNPPPPEMDGGRPVPPDAGPIDAMMDALEPDALPKDCVDMFGGGQPAVCCPEPAPSCADKPNGYPGYFCVSRANQFCSCSCNTGQWICAC
jgi:hypothetical protein